MVRHVVASSQVTLVVVVFLLNLQQHGEVMIMKILSLNNSIMPALAFYIF